MTNGSTVTDDLRSRFLTMASQDDPYPFISTVESYLAQVPEDYPVRGLAIKSLAQKGLFSVAVELGCACPRTCPDADQLIAAAEQLARVPNEIIPWRNTQELFGKNLTALSSRGEPGKTLADALARLWTDMERDLTLHRANDGNLLVRGSRSDGARIWIPAALNFAGAVEHVGDGMVLKGTVAPPLLIDGVGMGWWLRGLYEVTSKTYLDYSNAIYVVETNPRALSLVLHIQDWTVQLTDPRVYLFVGPQAWEIWRDTLMADPLLPVPATCSTTVRWPGQMASPAQRRMTEVNEHRLATLRQLRQQAEDIYADRDVAWWAKRYASAGPDDPLRVLCVTSRFTTFLKHSMRDTIQALERAGFATRLLIEEADHLTVGPHAYMEAFIEFQPDLALLIDHHRHEQANAFIRNVPLACWIQDPLPHLMCRRAAEPLGPLDFTFGFFKERCVREFGYPADRFFTASIPVAHSMFSDELVSEEEARQFTCDVMYVGHLNQTIEALRSQWRSEQPREIHPILDNIDALVDETLARGDHLRQHYTTKDPTALVRRLAGERGPYLQPESAERLFSFYTYRAFDIGFRVQTLEWVAQWARNSKRVFKLYGKGWQDLPELAPFAMGPIDHGEMLRKAYRSARFAIQTMPAGFQHQRSLEAIASGCLVLCRYIASDFGGLSLEEAGKRRAAGELLAGPAARFPLLDQLAFRSPDEMALVAQRFLEDPELHGRVLADCRQRVFDRFSYDKIIPEIIGRIAESLQQQAKNSK